MIALFFLFLTLSVSPFKSKSRLEAENAALRHQLIVLQRKLRGRVRLTNGPASSYAFSTAAALHAKATLATSPLDRMRAYLIGGLHRLEFQESCPVFRFQSNFPVKADAHTMRSAETPVYTENLILIDYVTESPNVNGDDRALLPLPDP